MKKLDRYQGSLIGLAVGDALGATNEFTPTPQKMTDIVGGGMYNLKAGEGTDDTAMTVILAKSLISYNGFCADHVAATFLEWIDSKLEDDNLPCIGIGSTTINSLERVRAHGYPYAGDLTSIGNGSLMRLAPVSLMYHGDVFESIFFAMEQSRITHTSQECLDACKLLTVYIDHALEGISKNIILSRIPVFNEVPLVENIAKIEAGSFKRLTTDDLKNPSSFVATILEIALWAFHKFDTFEEGMIELANLSGDSDTNCAVYGQLAGAYYGFDAIPSRWVDKLVHKDTMMDLAGGLYNEL